jgi:hypothetical protein
MRIHLPVSPFVPSATPIRHVRDYNRMSGCPAGIRWDAAILVLLLLQQLGTRQAILGE